MGSVLLSAAAAAVYDSRSSSGRLRGGGCIVQLLLLLRQPGHQERQEPIGPPLLLQFMTAGASQGEGSSISPPLP